MGIVRSGTGWFRSGIEVVSVWLRFCIENGHWFHVVGVALLALRLWFHVVGFTLLVLR